MPRGLWLAVALLAFGGCSALAPNAEYGNQPAYPTASYPPPEYPPGVYPPSPYDPNAAYPGYDYSGAHLRSLKGAHRCRWSSSAASGASTITNVIGAVPPTTSAAISKSAGTAVSKSTGTAVSKSTGTAVSKSTGTAVSRSAGTLARSFALTNGDLAKATGSRVRKAVRPRSASVPALLPARSLAFVQQSRPGQ